MKVIFAVLALVALGYSQEASEPIPILRFDSEGPSPEGSYKYSYETGNGISAEEQGELKNAGNEELEALEVRGSYQYTAPDGSLVSVTYIANENGFQPTGTHISVPGSAPHVPARAGGPDEIAQRSQAGAPGPAVAQPEASQQPAAESAPAEPEGPPAGPPEGEVPEDAAPASDAEASFLRPVYRARTGKAYNNKYYQPRKY